MVKRLTRKKQITNSAQRTSVMTNQLTLFSSNEVALSFLAFCVILVGCEKKGPVTVPVHGTLTFNGGPCPQSGTVHFAPLHAAEGLPLRPGSGDFDVDGTFEVTSFELGDGLVPGTYRVRIECWEQYPGDFRPGVSYVPEKYEPEQLVIEDDTREAVEVSYDVPPKL